MAKYYISTGLKVWANGYQGKISLMHKRKGTWNVVLVSGNKVKYLGVTHDSNIVFDEEKLRKLISKRLFS